MNAGSRRSTGGLSRQIDLSFRFFACTRTFKPQLPEIEPWRADLGKTKNDPTVMIRRDVRSRTGGYEKAPSSIRNASASAATALSDAPAGLSGVVNGSV